MAANGDSKRENDVVPGKTKDILCQPCSQLDKQSAAEIFCSVCEEFQCTDCLKIHYKYAYMKGHKLVNTNEAERKQVSFDMKGFDRCNQHQKFIKFFCEDENQLCCSTCAIVDHRRCKSVVNIQMVEGKLATKNSRMKVKLQEVKKKAEIIISNVVYSKEKLDDDVKEIPVKISRMRDEVIKMFDELEISVVRDAETFRTETFEKLTMKQSQNEKYLADTQSCLEIIERVHQYGTLEQQFIVEQKIKEEVNVLDRRVDDECHDLETMTILFDFDETLKLPPLPIIDYSPGHLSFKSHMSEAARTICPDVKTMKLTPDTSVELKQRKGDKREPFLTGIDFLPDGRLVAVDNNNMKCLLYDVKLAKVGSYQLSFPPQCVVAVSEQEVAITSYKLLELDFLRVSKSNKITLERTFKMTTSYESVCLSNDGSFVAGTNDHSKPVRIISSTGVEKDFNINFPNKKYSIGTSACTYIRNSNKVVLSDRYENTVYIYDVQTKTRVVVKDDQIKEPCGAAVGPYETILVCCGKTHSIVQISQTGRILSSYKTEINFPSLICVSRDKSFLVVTNICSDDRRIQKLKITY